MTPIEQTILSNGDTHGDCVRACTASMLNMSIENVPNFIIFDKWYKKWINFLYKHDIKLKKIPFKNNIPTFKNYYFVSGNTCRKTHHMVIMKDGKIVHDPHPSKNGIIDICHIWEIE